MEEVQIHGEASTNSNIRYNIYPNIHFFKLVKAKLIQNNNKNIFFNINMKSILMPISKYDNNDISYKITIGAQLAKTILFKQHNTNRIQLLDLED